jgi:2-polyprenyl-6-methoxyphenol hydroxylase-like FAD-dependent oxidoreductase
MEERAMTDAGIDRGDVRNEVADVVIVGAGPVGLMLAGELGRAGVRSLVIEREPERSDMPKANGLVGRSATVVARRGLLRGMPRAHAIPVPRFPFGPLQLRLNPLRRNPLRVLPIPQRRLEEALERDALARGARIRRGHAVSAFSEDADGVRISVSTAGTAGSADATDGGYELRARYLVGCDGAHSVVRHHLGVGFPGTTSGEITRIGRVTIPAGAVRRVRGFLEFHGGRRLALFQPNRTGAGSISLAPAVALDRAAPPGLYIVGTQEERGSAEPAERIPLEELRESIRRVLGEDLPLESGEWLRSTVANSRQAGRYRVGRVFLAGDAAHVFSAGGSALNVGILDAVDLAPRLAAVLAGRARPESLERYHEERHRAGERALLQTRAQAALSAPGPEAEALRQVLAGAIRARNPRRYLAALLIGDS